MIGTPPAVCDATEELGQKSTDRSTPTWHLRSPHHLWPWISHVPTRHESPPRHQVARNSGSQSLSVVGESQTPNLRCQRRRFETEQFQSGGNAPQFHGPVLTAAGQGLSVRRESQCIDVIRVPDQDSDLLSSGRGPTAGLRDRCCPRPTGDRRERRPVHRPRSRCPSMLGSGCRRATSQRLIEWSEQPA